MEQITPPVTDKGRQMLGMDLGSVCGAVTAQPRVSRICIGRLHNLGNFEHIRYEVTVEVPEGADAAETLKRLKTILEEVETKSPHDSYAIKRAENIMSAAQQELAQGLTMTPEQAKIYKENVENSKKVLDEVNAVKQRRADALAALNSLGGSTFYRDAKDDWNDDDQL